MPDTISDFADLIKRYGAREVLAELLISHPTEYMALTKCIRIKPEKPVAMLFKQW